MCYASASRPSGAWMSTSNVKTRSTKWDPSVLSVSTSPIFKDAKSIIIWIPPPPVSLWARMCFASASTVSCAWISTVNVKTRSTEWTLPCHSSVSTLPIFKDANCQVFQLVEGQLFQFNFPSHRSANMSTALWVLSKWSLSALWVLSECSLSAL